MYTWWLRCPLQDNFLVYYSLSCYWMEKSFHCFGLETAHLGSIVTHSLKNKCEERQTLLSSHCSHIDKTYFSPGMSRRLVNPVQLISKSCFLKRRESIKHLKYFQVSQQMQTGLCKWNNCDTHHFPRGNTSKTAFFHCTWRSASVFTFW